MAASWRLFAAAYKAHQTWNRMSPEQKAMAMDTARRAGAAGGKQAKVIAENARAQAPGAAEAAKKVAGETAKTAGETAKTQGPVLAREVMRRAQDGAARAGTMASEFLRNRRQ